MAEVKIAADSGGGSVGLVGPSTTTSNAAVQFKLPVADGSAGQVLQTDGSGNLSWVTPGITEADQWRVNAQSTLGDVGDILTSGWERIDTAPNSGKLGTGMSQSSGVFTFPSTGWWLVKFAGGFVSTGDKWICAQLHTNSNTALTEACGNINNYSGGNESLRLHFDLLLDITDTSADSQKIKLRVVSDGDVTLQYSNEEQRFGFTFIRLGDT